MKLAQTFWTMFPNSNIGLTSEIARENLKQAQTKMKKWYDKDAKCREFNPGDKMLSCFQYLDTHFRPDTMSPM